MTKIILIDDEPDVRYSLRSILENEGYEVMEASDGDEGVKKFKELTAAPVPPIVIIDMIMRNKHGYETINEIQEINPETKIIAISGGGMHLKTEKFLAMSKNLGVDKTLAKPFLGKDLIDAILGVLH